MERLYASIYLFICLFCYAEIVYELIFGLSILMFEITYKYYAWIRILKIKVYLNQIFNETNKTTH